MPLVQNFALSLLSVAVAFLVAGCTTPTAEPRNLSLLKQEIRAYVESGDYARQISAVATRAGWWIEQRARTARDPATAAREGRMTVIFDLDETLLSNWP
ncbi:MAG: hypothetical protein RIQ93_2057, partial [Verrucomicrobiota bacterium]